MISICLIKNSLIFSALLMVTKWLGQRGGYCVQLSIVKQSKGIGISLK